jgi:hypothetical protein
MDLLKSSFCSCVPFVKLTVPKVVRVFTVVTLKKHKSIDDASRNAVNNTWKSKPAAKLGLWQTVGMRKCSY